MNRIILILGLGLCSILMSPLVQAYVICKWEGMQPNRVISLTSRGFVELVQAYTTPKANYAPCGDTECFTGFTYVIPNMTYTVTASVSIKCINTGNQVENIDFQYSKNTGAVHPGNFKNVTMTISGAGPTITVPNLESQGQNFNLRSWNDGILAPCQRDCGAATTGWPQYNKTLFFTFTAQPIDTESSQWGVGWHYMNNIGNIYIPGSYTDSVFVGGFLCPAGYTDCRPEGNIGEGSTKPPIVEPIPQCTLRVVTPDLIQFQPISTDDLSRNRVRLEDFTLTAIKGPSQSQACVGSMYNLPGEIKTEGGYFISNTFWGINQLNGQPQGIGLKIYDLDLGNYLQFNYKYPSFIKDISSLNEVKRLRAEISATTNELDKIKAGEYSQVLTFEVRMP
ncbi:hypothetical protein ACBQ54_18360 [Providencia vermicola]|uniref:hypothetical protein n=1 Tax=Providencia vermicola TaxID=333965 RepID=UPI002AB3D3D3|nr:hypothetical protein [Providencia stuartii]